MISPIFHPLGVDQSKTDNPGQIQETLQKKITHLHGLVGEKFVALIQVRWPSAVPHVGSNWHVHAWMDWWMDRLKLCDFDIYIYIYILVTFLVLLGIFSFWLGKVEFSSFFDTFLTTSLVLLMPMWQGPCLHGSSVSKNAFVNGIATVWEPVLSKHALWPVEIPFCTWTQEPWTKMTATVLALAQLFVYVKWSSQFWVPHEWNSEHFYWSGVIAATRGMWEHDLEVNHSPAVPGFKDWHAAQQKIQGKTASLSAAVLFHIILVFILV